MSLIEQTIFPIGVVHSPYRVQKGTPVQPNQAEAVTAEIHVFPEYREGLEDLDRFDRLWILSWLDRSKPFRLKVIPYRDTVERGLFSTRAPSRPNPIGISCVKLISVDIDTGVITVSGIDLLDGTPVLDIKPYAALFDSFPSVKSGWLDGSHSANTADDRF